MAYPMHARLQVDHIDAVAITVTFTVVGSAYAGGKFRASGAGRMVGAASNGPNSTFAQTFGLVTQQGAQGTMS